MFSALKCFGLEGGRAIARMLQHNSTLSELGLYCKLLLCLHTLRCMLLYILS